MEVIMKKTKFNTGHKIITVYGNKILLDFNKNEISFADGTSEETIEYISEYLVDEGFIVEKNGKGVLCRLE
tara:strand:+ start:268 stop:480 length:213 start_codon:yes stop_codon:yes gene_type:complete